MKRVLPIVTFALVLGIHAVWLTRGTEPGPWAPVGEQETAPWWSSYLSGGSVWLGLSYATAAAFAVFCLVRLREHRRRAAAGAAGGLGLVGFLGVVGCSLLGCCGSPMLAVYVSLFGSRAAGVAGPLVFTLTIVSVAAGYVLVTRRGACACSGAAEAGDDPNDAGAHWITGHIDTPAGEAPQVATILTRADRLGTLKARLGVGRMHYSIAPGLYAVGSPTAESAVLVTANYKMSFDHLRRELAGRDAWIMVLDTKGINVWCAAGKHTFGTTEIVERIKATRLHEIVSHRTLVLPQLGAPGVAAHAVKSRSGFRVVYGPVRAADLPAFLDAGMKATAEMRQVTFTIGHRLALVPLEMILWPKFLALIPLVFLILGGLGSGGYSLDAMLAVGGRAVLLCLLAFVGGTVVVPALLPWLPGRAFSMKGTVVGLLLAIAVIAFSWHDPVTMRWRLDTAAWCLIMPAIASFFAMNFTGASTYTSLSGVKAEMRIAVPAQIAAAAVGFVVWMLARFA